MNNSLSQFTGWDDFHQTFPSFSSLFSTPFERIIQADLFTQYQALTLRRLFDFYHICPHGVVHAGAHKGEELFLYLLLGFRNVILIEPNPYLHEQLRSLSEIISHLSSEMDVFSAEKTTPNPMVIKVVEAAVGRTSGQQDLFVTEETKLASLLKPNDNYFKGRSTNANVTSVIKVTTTTIDQILSSHAQDATYNYLRLNIQGSELECLGGAAHSLKHFEVVESEVSMLPRYFGCPTHQDLDQFMTDSGFVAVRRIFGGLVGNIIYVRRDIVSSIT